MEMALYDRERNPFKDARAAFEKAQTEYKVILVDIGGDWCVWCIRLDDFINDHPDLRELVEQYYTRVRVYADFSQTNWQFLAELPRVDVIPYFFVFNRDGVLLHAQDTGEFEEGDSYNYERLKAFFEYWADAHLPPELLTTHEKVRLTDTEKK
jgi:hypothetical protein